MSKERDLKFMELITARRELKFLRIKEVNTSTSLEQLKKDIEWKINQLEEELGVTKECNVLSSSMQNIDASYSQIGNEEIKE